MQGRVLSRKLSWRGDGAMRCAVGGERSGEAFLRRGHLSRDLYNVREGAVKVLGEKVVQTEGQQGRRP